MPLKIALDLPSSSFDDLGIEGKGVVWPTSLPDYLDISNKITSRFNHAVRETGLSEIAEISAISVLGMLIVDAERVVKTAYDLENIRRQDGVCIFDETHSPVTAYLAMSDLSDEIDNLSISDFFPDKSQRLDLKTKLWNLARLAKTNWEMCTHKIAGRLDLHNDSFLMREYLNEADWDTVFLRPEVWFPQQEIPIVGELLDLSRFMGNVVNEILDAYGCEAHLCRRSRAIIESFARERLTSAYSKASAIAKMRLEKMAGDVLIGGTPKDIGRILNWRYQQMGKKVWRFSHGGDRAFFIDPIWSITELPYVDNYHVHGSGEANVLQKRYDNQKFFMPPGRPMKFTSHGSRKHQQLWRDGQKQKNKLTAKEPLRVVLVSGSFLGEKFMGPLTFKLPDPLIADTQRQLINVLIRHGYEVYLKAHPKGLFSDQRVHGHNDLLSLSAPFDPVAIEADCYLFEFAGSAFFDALASEKGVVLVDMGNRPWDETGRSDLESRCEIIEAHPDEYNRIRVSEDLLIEAVEKACNVRECPKSFADKYFFASHR